ncbi:3'-5' exonuclease [Paenibacillus sedimenti]|uniref:3'-5' exonuclease n=1 Tax=Paenibacillus sedimenti TaxID=2770274 RepID=A0A926KXA9_9BACL|nr:3'-5' exonuclease [Paenibacillus sedimenti]MBD0384871.1 3'-5' exonuclease [Paenibacillus sedimenti]
MKISYLSKDKYEVEGIYIPNLLSNKYCVFDFEGTGINFRTEFITQIGAVIIEDNLNKSFNSLVKSPKPIPLAVEQLTGISNHDMMHAPSFPEAYSQFIEFIGDCVLVTQAGYEYDVPLLEKLCQIHNLPFIQNGIIDTKALFTNIHQEITEVVSTDFLIKYYNIDTSNLKRHDALDDCKIIGKIFARIIKEYEEQSINDFRILERLKVKRFIIPEMYLEEGNNFC